MSLSEATGSGSEPSTGVVKTLAIRLELDQHAELTLIAQLRGNTVTDEIREAIEAHIMRIKADPIYASKADQVLADIERQATARRDAFARLFGDNRPAASAAQDPAAPVVEPASTGRGRRSSPPAGS